MIVASIKPSDALKEVMQGAFPTTLMSVSSMPLCALSESKNQNIRNGQYELNDILEMGTLALKRIREKLLPYVSEITHYQESIKEKYMESETINPEDLYLQLSLDFIYATSEIGEDIFENEDGFRFYSVVIGASEPQREKLIYKLDSRFFNMLESISKEKRKTVETNDKYIGVFFMSLADIFAYRDFLFFRSGSETDNLVEIGEERYREEYLSKPEKELIYAS